MNPGQTVAFGESSAISSSQRRYMHDTLGRSADRWVAEATSCDPRRRLYITESLCNIHLQALSNINSRLCNTFIHVVRKLSPKYSMRNL